MFIVWRGYGWLVAVIVFGCSLVANLLFNTLYGDDYYDRHRWPLAVAILSAGVICWSLGNCLRRRSDRVVIDKATGREIVMNQSCHALFFIPMHLWGPVLALIACVLLFLEFNWR